MPPVFYAPAGLLRTLAHLNAFLDGRTTRRLAEASHVVGWGYRPSGRRAQRLARRRRLACLCVEDGLLCSSPGLPAHFRLSLAVDTQAPYFDTSRPTDLEALVRTSSADASRAEAWMTRWREAGCAKYAQDRIQPVPAAIVEARAAGREIVVLLDQLAGDASLAPELTGPAPFERMVRTARERHPQALLVLKKHPREGARGARWRTRRGALRAYTVPEALVCEGTVPMGALACYATRMYTVTSQAGFEALVWGCPVVCVGHPWYAGWGLTEDLYVPARRQGLPRRTLAELFAAALGHYCRYVHPATGERIGFEDALAHVELQQAVRRATPSRVAIVEAQSWKRSVYRDFLPGAQLAFVPRSAVGASIDTSWHLLTWGQRIEQACVDRWRALGWRVWQCEDGFLRSVALGCELARPISLSFDEAGLYADPRTASELLAAIARPLEPAQQLNARRFLRLHRDLRLAKYVGTTRPEGVHWRTAERLAARDAPVLLVCGQVADDISMRASECPFPSFERLVQHLRALNPRAFIVFRPHPDVVKGLRPGEMEVTSADWCDAQSATRALVELASQVHVVNSLSGFEALMAGAHVVTWGRGWYAGWGLTEDRVQPMRSRPASLLQLVHAAYLERPRYFDHHCRQFVTAPVAAELLARERAQPDAAPNWVARALAWLPRGLTRTAAQVYERWSDGRQRRTLR